MKKEIELQKQKVEYTLRKSKRAHKMRLAVYCDGSFVVTAPWRLSENIIERFIIEKSNWVVSRIEHFKNTPKPVFLKGTKKDYAQYKEQALVLVKKRIDYFNKIYNFKFNKVNIKNQKTRWGSCSKKGNLNFNYRIVLIGDRLADYIIVHELCHLKEFNHKQKFWNLVEKTIPDYLKIKKELKEGVLKIT